MGATETELRLAWERVAGRSRAARTLFEQIAERHRQPHRRYHDLRHVVWVIRHVYELAADEPMTDLGAVVAAACYHDAVYLARPGEDERASADLARRELSELIGIDAVDRETTWTADRVERVAHLVLATAHLAADEPTHDESAPTTDDPTDTTHDDTTHDEAVLVDADLAVLGAPPAAYLDYVRGVRAEHPDLAETDWRTGRATVLQTLLSRPTLFRTSSGRERWEARARANLTAELVGLEPPEREDHQADEQE